MVIIVKPKKKIPSLSIVTEIADELQLSSWTRSSNSLVGLQYKSYGGALAVPNILLEGC